MDKDIYLIGPMRENLVGLKLPTLNEVMSLLFYQHKYLDLKLKPSVSITVDKVLEKWKLAGIPTSNKKYIVKKLSNFYTLWQNLQRNKHSKSSPAQKKKEDMFSLKLRQLFDIARLNAYKFLDDDKKIFLKSQRSANRYGFIDINDKSNAEHKETMKMDIKGKYFLYVKILYDNIIRSKPSLSLS